MDPLVLIDQVCRHLQHAADELPSTMQQCWSGSAQQAFATELGSIVWLLDHTLEHVRALRVVGGTGVGRAGGGVGGGDVGVLGVDPSWWMPQ